MVKWICWNDIFDEKMKDPVYREKFERGYAEFTKEIEAELAAERMCAEMGRLRTAPVRSTVKRKPHAFSARLKRARVTA